jgi:SAM-dependent methyltransferase
MEEELYDELRSIEDVHWWLVARRRIFLHFLGRLAARVPREPLVLDCGFGTGGLLRRLDTFARPVGVDMKLRAVRDCRDQGHDCVVQAKAEELPFGIGTFDIICAFDVLEHLDDDLAALNQWRELLKPDGHLLISVPAYRFLWDSQDDLANHKRRYALRELRAKLTDCKLVVRKITYFNTMLFPLVLIIRLLRKAQSAVVGETMNKSDFSLTRAGKINDLLCEIFTSEIRLLSTLNFPFGGSIFCIAGRG